MKTSMRSILSIAAVLCIGACAVSADDSPDKTPQTLASPVNAAVDGNFDTRIDTWCEGVVVKLDAAGAAIAVAGHAMPYASAHAGMLNETATKTVGLTPEARAAKEEEVRLAWKEKLAKAETADVSKDAEMQFKVPAQGKVTILKEDDLPNLDFLHHEKGMATVPPASPAALPDVQPSPRNDQASAPGDASKSTEQKQFAALDAFGKLKVGEPVYLGYASGTVTNEVHCVIKRVNLNPSEPGKN